MGGSASALVAVCFTDLVGSTELMAALGDRTWDRIRAEHFAVLRTALRAHGGDEIKNTGDGIMAVFASAGEAVDGAVALQQAVEAHSRRAGVALVIRVGLALGDVTREEDDAFGTPVVEAARLVAVARPGQILCTAVVRALGGARTTARFTDVGPLELKGLPEAVPACEVAWEPEQPARDLPPLLAGSGRLFVGREDHLIRLRQAWKEAGAGEKRLVLLGGEPGIGKTRLAAEFAAKVVPADRSMVLAGRSDEDLAVPYQPFAEALRHYVSTTAADLRLGGHPGELVRLVPEVAERQPGLPEPVRADPETERYRLFEAVAGWLAAVSADAPVLLVLDDLHWAAKPTIMLLRHVMRSDQPMRLLM
ncbi:MAG: adenylate/guanylate cyclase domain-containing protein, partial [Actinobacteria bacterium]|nr:adenylate/guanylate cyclase domain-containing protein [Actinomycetota bacterium]